MILKFYNYLKIYGPIRLFQYLIREVRMLKRGFFQKSFSQNGEDILIDNLLGNRKSGFYVDVGAYNPTRLSNTKRFYTRGWMGINIEPDPRKIKKFYKSRPKDINLNIGVANKNSKLVYFEFEPNTLSTFSKVAAKEYQEKRFRLVGTSEIKVSKLSNIFQEYCKDKEIDFLSVDAEGYDLEVLKSNDWKKYKPRLVCVESNPLTDSDLEKLLVKVGYRKVCKNLNNLIFCLRSIKRFF